MIIDVGKIIMTRIVGWEVSRGVIKIYDYL